MCRISAVFYDICGHIGTRCQSCTAERCTFPSIRYYVVNTIEPCPKCIVDPQNPRVSEDVQYLRQRYFFRRAVRQDLDRQSRETIFRNQWRHRHMFHASAEPHPYSLYDPQLPPQLLSLVNPLGLENDKDRQHCTICGCTFHNFTDAAERTHENEYPVRLPCHPTHVFGHACIVQWFADPANNTCPNCRAPFTILRAAPKELLAIHTTERIARAADPAYSRPRQGQVVVTCLNGVPSMVDLRNPLLADLDNEDLDGVVSIDSEVFEEVDGADEGVVFVYGGGDGVREPRIVVTVDVLWEDANYLTQYDVVFGRANAFNEVNSMMEAFARGEEQAISLFDIPDLLHFIDWNHRTWQEMD